jgi:predicted phage terminase large subunit-like protein
MCQEEAGARNRLILETAEKDGPAIPVGIESVAGYKDTYTILRDILTGLRTVQKIAVSSDKVVRAGTVEPIFESGHVHLRRAWWNDRALTQLAQFPAAAHDDIVDAITGGHAMAERLTARPSRMIGA